MTSRLDAFLFAALALVVGLTGGSVVVVALLLVLAQLVVIAGLLVQIRDHVNGDVR